MRKFIVLLAVVLCACEHQGSERSPETGPASSTTTKLAFFVNTLPASPAKRNMERFLAARGLSVCGVHTWIETMEHTTRRKIETDYATVGLLERENLIEKLRARKWKTYLLKHNIPESLRSYVITYGIRECP